METGSSRDQCEPTSGIAVGRWVISSARQRCAAGGPGRPPRRRAATVLSVALSAVAPAHRLTHRSEGAQHGGRPGPAARVPPARGSAPPARAPRGAGALRLPAAAGLQARHRDRRRPAARLPPAGAGVGARETAGRPRSAAARPGLPRRPDAVTASRPSDTSSRPVVTSRLRCSRRTASAAAVTVNEATTSRTTRMTAKNSNIRCSLGTHSDRSALPPSSPGRPCRGAAEVPRPVRAQGPRHRPLHRALRVVGGGRAGL